MRGDPSGRGTVRVIVGRLFATVACVLAVATLVSLIPSNSWWIRALDFPRLLILVAIGVTAIGVAVTMIGRWAWIVIAVLAFAAGLQAWRIYPYYWFAPVEVARADRVAPDDRASCFSVLGLNVYQHNRDYTPTRRLIDRMKPDILLLMETDQRWVSALAPSLVRYRTRVVRPLGNTYGLVFATNLPVRSAGTRNITDRDTPTLYARLSARDGRPFDYVGLHPRPPLPGQDTDLRDRKIEHAALAVADHDVPRMAMGDFNDVAWSRTTQLFKQVGGFLDPRIGRGSFPSFPADYVSLGWPLDQLFLSPGFTFRDLRILPDVHSDHRPLAATVCLAGDRARARNGSPDDLDAQARAAARSMSER
ncbi:endonuclease/exonuclease/phosphatase family protein [Sphingomonas rubra]|uniref:Uncharacterized conserved protein YafD, endonuclease/exonuclease/phosphatase (EEP) superfamily n=1 Tax=Sphingomonas rubra TaxID=634430 RepID=A0A1I5RQA7_9SPHN|nr:endonuclease/exonuclease/phosphatase family protein [Sphingomonas rubra]SFP60086.1 Uncharacterized conserved protein YafD, endonuclease/exonuclease/phosphatase (EEP) superfamily [Sphingomonas rubra]